MDREKQSVMASHQFLLSSEVCVMTSVTTYDKSDEALVEVVGLCLKPLDINLEGDGRRWSEGQAGEGMSEKARQRAATA